MFEQAQANSMAQICFELLIFTKQSMWETLFCAIYSMKNSGLIPTPTQLNDWAKTLCLKHRRASAELSYVPILSLYFPCDCVERSTIRTATAWQIHGGGRSRTAKQGLHKQDLTYLLKRLKCKLTENVFSLRHLLAALGSRPIRRLPVLSHHCEVRNGRRLRFPLLEEPSGGSTAFVCGFNEWHPTSVRRSRPPHSGCPHHYPPPNPAPA